MANPSENALRVAADASDLPPHFGVSARSAWTYLRSGVGLLLLVTAALKFHGLIANPGFGNSVVDTPQVRVVTIECEILVGVWLLSGLLVRIAWLVALALFSVFGAASLWLALGGQADCGCFGEVKANPWWTFCLDITIVGSLLLVRPAKDQPVVFRPAVRRAATIALGALLCLAFSAGIFLLAFDSPAQAIAHLRGELLAVSPARTDLGTGRPGEAKSFIVEFTNHSTKPVRIVGGTATCNCTTTKSLPLSVGPGEAGSISILVTYGSRTGPFQHEFVLYTSDEEQPVVRCWFSGGVVAPGR